MKKTIYEEIQETFIDTTQEHAFYDNISRMLPQQEVAILQEAYRFSAEHLHTNISPSFQVADMLVKQGADTTTIASTLLIPTLRHQLAGIREIRERFGSDIAKTLAHFKQPEFNQQKTESPQQENIRQFLVSLSDNTRIPLIRLAFRLIDLECATETDMNNCQKMARETMDIYVPIAGRMGLGHLRNRLEDVCFRILDPKTYNSLKNRISPIRTEDENCLRLLIEGTKQILEKSKIKHKIQGRTKSIYSIHKKMVRLGVDLDAIMDRIGLRIIVNSVPDCYRVLGLLHTHFKPIPSAFDDYIGLPKKNGYQSLHTCVYPVRDISHKSIEFQVRTDLMHMEAEYGIAAHWRYKSDSDIAVNEEKHAVWMKNLVNHENDSVTSEEFIERLNQQVFHDRIVIFGNAGRMVWLPETATVSDYLKEIGVNMNNSIKIRINGNIVDLYHNLNDGDSIELLAITS